MTFSQLRHQLRHFLTGGYLSVTTGRNWTRPGLLENGGATSSASTQNVSIAPAPSTPGTITQTPSGNVCVAQTGIVYSINSVPNATSYTWTVPSDATITSPGSGGTTYTGNTTSITVSWGSSAGSVSVTASSCSGATSSAGTQSVSLTAPSTPGTITQTPSGVLCASQTGIVYSISSVSGPAIVPTLRVFLSWDSQLQSRSVNAKAMRYLM